MSQVEKPENMLDKGFNFDLMIYLIRKTAAD